MISDKRNADIISKNMEAVKSAVRSDFISSQFVMRGKCCRCKKKRAVVRQTHQSTLLVAGNITPSVLEEEEEVGIGDDGLIATRLDYADKRYSMKINA